MGTPLDLGDCVAEGPGPTSHDELSTEDISVSGLWTPSGEHEPRSEPSGAGSTESISSPHFSPEEQQGHDELARMRAELAATPVVDIVANHAIGLWQLAVLHLGLDGDRPPNLSEASLAIDAMGTLVDGLGDRLQDNAQPLRDALAQLRLAYVQVDRIVEGEHPPASGS